MVDADTGDGEFFGSSEVDYYLRDYVDVPDAPLLRCYDGRYAAAIHRYHLLLENVSASHTIACDQPPTLAAAFTAWQHPDTFGNVIALSGSFWWRPEDEAEWEWLTRQFALRPLAPLRFYLEVGLLESAPSASGFPGQLLANRHLRTVLQAKGYELHYDEQMHGHDSMPWQGLLAEGLRALDSPLSATSRNISRPK